MGIRGRKPSVETALTSRDAYVPTGIAGSVEKPADLTPAAEGIWDVLLDDLLQMGVFRPADSLILVELCEMLAEAKRLRLSMHKPPTGWLRFEKDISEDQRATLELLPEHEQAALWQLSGGYKKVRAAYLGTMRQLKSYIDEFGVTPVARLRLGLLQLQGQTLGGLFGGEDDDSDVGPAARTLEGEFRDAG